MNIFKKEQSYSKQIIKENLLKQWFLIITLLIIGIIFLLYSIKNIGPLNLYSLLILFSMVIGAILCLTLIWIAKIINSFFLKTDSNINKGKKGNDGEELAYLKLVKILDQRYKIYKNFKIKGNKFDLDCLIIGPKGLIVLEIKNSSNSYIFKEKEAIKVKGSGYSQERTLLYGNCDPRIKLINYCKLLNNQLALVGLGHVKARKALVFVDSNVNIEGKSVVFVIKNLGELDKYFSSLKEDDRFSLGFCEKIIKKLEEIKG